MLFLLLFVAVDSGTWVRRYLLYLPLAKFVSGRLPPTDRSVCIMFDAPPPPRHTEQLNLPADKWAQKSNTNMCVCTSLGHVVSAYEEEIHVFSQKKWSCRSFRYYLEAWREGRGRGLLLAVHGEIVGREAMN